MFEINFNKVVVWLLPTFMRVPFWVNYFIAVVSPFVKIYNAFTTKRAETIYKLNHNSQVCYLEGALNDTFDPIERLIYLQDAGGYEAIGVNRDSDLQDLAIQSDALPSDFMLHNDSAYNGGSYDFVVVLPYQLSSSMIYRLKALVNYYKLAGKRYDIIY